MFSARLTRETVFSDLNDWMISHRFSSGSGVIACHAPSSVHTELAKAFECGVIFYSYASNEGTIHGWNGLRDLGPNSATVRCEIRAPLLGAGGIGVHGSHTPGWLAGCSRCMKLGLECIAGLSSPNQITHVYAHFPSRVSPRNHAPFGSWFFGAHLSVPSLWLPSVIRSENRRKPDISPGGSRQAFQ